MTSTRKDQRDARQARSRRIRAILAGGLVLGVGVTATLAAWNDSEFGSTTFTAGTFNIVGSTDGTNFSQHASAPGASLTFAAPSVSISALTPGDKAYAFFSVKTVNPSMAGSVLIKGASSNASSLGAQLTYSVRTVTAAANCSSTGWATASVVTGLPNGAALTAAATSSQVLNADGGNQVNYCIEVAMSATAPTTVQGTSQQVTWEFAATSGS